MVSNIQRNLQTLRTNFERKLLLPFNIPNTFKNICPKTYVADGVINSYFI